MAGEANARPLLPQTSQTQSYSFAPQILAPREPQQRNYVFVDEHNRHKRLKVMRACEGCRRRKIKCDSATTNSWPCAACTRLKLNCVPPTVSYEKDTATPGIHTFEIPSRNDYPTIPVGTIGDYHRQVSMPPQQQYASLGASMPTQVQVPYSETMQIYPSTGYMQATTGQEVLQYSAMVATAMPAHEMNKYQDLYTAPPSSRPSIASETTWKTDVTGSSGSTLAEGLSEALGELKINLVGTSPYIADKKKLAEVPALEETEIMNLPQDISPDSRVRIPASLMPTDEQAMQYFEYFFTNIHPFVPVLNRTSFYHQWSANRESISPLLLEAIFACSAMMLDDHVKGQQFLALASKHEESFKDVPRLSTIQAMLLLLKARESAPKRGYFYRSWMLVVNVVAMAKDLELDQHYDLHMSGQSCDSSLYDCVCKTRCWQLMYVLEVMIGGPQGRLDFSVLQDTVDFTLPQHTAGIDDNEMQVSRQMVCLARGVRNVKDTMMLYGRLRKAKKDWMADPEYTAHDQDFHQWLRDLPKEFQIAFPADGSPPWIPSSFIGHMHCYYYLSIIMHQRPQLRNLEEATDIVSLRQHMSICHDAAKKMCRIQESILQSFGLQGLLAMQRGINFTIYSVLSCTMLHLVLITSPFPELNGEARDYFVRHMRILEQVVPHWPMPEVQAQVNSLREAFSANTSKPFELKPNFPFGSPAPQANVSPAADGTYRTHPSGQDLSLEPTGQVNYNTIHPITPPISATDDESKTDSPVVQSLALMGNHQPNQSAAAAAAAAAVPTQEPLQQRQRQQQQQGWNPSRLFEQWSVAFGTPPPSAVSKPSSPLRAHQSGNFDLSSASQELGQQAYSPQPGSYSPHTSQMQSLPAVNLPTPAASYAGPTSAYVTPTMWQDVVASSFSDGLKRRWDYDGQVALSQMTKRQR